MLNNKTTGVRNIGTEKKATIAVKEGLERKNLFSLGEKGCHESKFSGQMCFKRESKP